MKKEAVSERGPSGLAEVRVLKDRYKVLFRKLFNEELKVLEDVNVTYEVGKDGDAPVVQDKNLRVGLSADKTSIYSCRPWSGSHFADFSRFVADDDGVPSFKNVPPRMVQGKKGKFPSPAHQEFTAIFTLIGDSQYAGLEVTQNFWNVFRRDSDGSTKLMGPGFAVDRLDDLFRIGGISQEDVIPFTDASTILIEAQKLLRDRQGHYVLELNEGWVREMSALPVGVTLGKRRKASKEEPVEVEVDEDEDE